jgi:hypothetical protein
MKLGAPIPILRIFNEDKARELYVDSSASRLNSSTGSSRARRST